MTREQWIRQAAVFAFAQVPTLTTSGAKKYAAELYDSLECPDRVDPEEYVAMDMSYWDDDE